MSMSEKDIAVLVRAMGPVLREKFDALEKRIDAMEGKGISFEGTHQRGLQYRRGMMVVSRGSLWVATRQTTSAPNEDDTWALAAKAGRDGKDMTHAGT